MTDLILTCNAGSNSLKCALYDIDLNLKARFEADRIHEKDSSVTVKSDQDEVLVQDQAGQGYESALDYFLKWKDQNIKATTRAAGHRIVHGGETFSRPVRISPDVKEVLEQLVPLAPSHQPHNLKLIDILAVKMPDLEQVACFDTSFHKTMPRVARQYGLPRELVEEEKIYRYGFHGLSYEYIAGILPDHIGSLENQKIIIAHLGGGCSACALKDGKSIATTMGFSALDGMMMNTRPGALDPGIFLYLLQEKKMNAEDLENLLYKKSGLLGVSGISADMRDLDDNPDEAAQKAVELFCYRAVEELGKLIAVLGGMDVLVFTGAMGEKDRIIRDQICSRLHWLGDFKTLALATDEEIVIARHTKEQLKETENG